MVVCCWAYRGFPESGSVNIPHQHAHQPRDETDHELLSISGDITSDIVGWGSSGLIFSHWVHRDARAVVLFVVVFWNILPCTLGNNIAFYYENLWPNSTSGWDRLLHTTHYWWIHPLPTICLIHLSSLITIVESLLIREWDRWLISSWRDK